MECPISWMTTSIQSKLDVLCQATVPAAPPRSGSFTKTRIVPYSGRRAAAVVTTRLLSPEIECRSAPLPQNVASK